MSLPNKMKKQLGDAALANERGVSYLESRLFLEALTEFGEAYQTALNLRQALCDSGLLAPLAGQQRCLFSTQQLLFPAYCNDPDDAVVGGIAEAYYFYRRGMAFMGGDTEPEAEMPLPEPRAHMLPPEPQELLHSCNLLLATCAYNLGLCFHLRSNVLDTEMGGAFRKFSLDFYDAAIETISVDGLIMSQNITLHNDSCSLLLVLLNNRAVLCFELEDFISCQAARMLLLLWLAVVRQHEEGFLTEDDITNMYGILASASFSGRSRLGQGTKCNSQHDHHRFLFTTITLWQRPNSCGAEGSSHDATPLHQ